MSGVPIGVLHFSVYSPTPPVLLCHAQATTVSVSSHASGTHWMSIVPQCYAPRCLFQPIVFCDACAQLVSLRAWQFPTA